MHGFSRGFGALQHPVFARRMPQPSPLRNGQRVARGGRRHSLRSALHRGPLVAWAGHVHCRQQAIVLKTINLNPVRMDQHPRGAPACFEQVLEESLETAPARVHRTNGLGSVENHSEMREWM